MSDTDDNIYSPRFEEILRWIEGEAPDQVVCRLRWALHDAGFPPVALANAVLGDPRSGKAPVAWAWHLDARQERPGAVAWHPTGDALNTGIALHGLRAFDVDVDDSGRAAACQEAVERRCGRSPAVRRRDGSGRRALLYRAAEGEPGKLWRNNTATGDKVEVLGRGQQLVCFGRHFSGADIWWRGTPGLEVHRGDLPEVTEEQVGAALAECAAIIAADPAREDVGDLGAAAPSLFADWISPARPRPAVAAASFGGHDPLTEEDVRACLAATPETGDYHEWIKRAAALHAWEREGGSGGLALFDEWSRTGGKYQGAADVRRNWEAARGMTRIGVGSLVHWARQADPAFRLPSRIDYATGGPPLGWAPKPSPADAPAEFFLDEGPPPNAPEPESEPGPTGASGTDTAAPPQPKKRRFPMMTDCEAAALPPPVFVIPGMLVANSIACLYGPPGSLKSFLALDIALSLAHGLPWCGHRLERRPVAYVAAEGGGGLGVRIAAWKHDRGVSDQPSLFRLLGEGVNLMDRGCVDALIGELQEAAREMGKPWGMVWFDTLARCAVGMEENSGKETGIALDSLSRIRHALATTVVVVHHTGKDVERGMRGSERLRGDLDTVVEVHREDGSPNLSTQVRKQKDGRDGQIRHFATAEVEFDRPRWGRTASLVVREAEEQPRAAKSVDELSTLRARIADGVNIDQPVSRSKLARDLGLPVNGKTTTKLGEAVPALGVAVESARHGGTVRLERDSEDQIVARKQRP